LREVASRHDGGVVGRAERTRERIVEVAHARVREVGIRRLAMDAVADEAGLSRAALYRHFPNKQALVDAVLEHNARLYRRELDAVLDGLETLEDKVAAAARFGQFPPRDLLLLGLAETDPGSLAMLLTTGAHQFLARATRFWAAHVEAAQAAGEVPAWLDPLQAGEWIARSLFSLATTPAATFDADDPVALERYARAFIFRGLHQK
jgi:AcrR family transcriptional regulator